MHVLAVWRAVQMTFGRFSDQPSTGAVGICIQQIATALQKAEQSRTKQSCQRQNELACFSGPRLSVPSSTVQIHIS
ncbi:hypothetical protein Cob_v008238 [Colletotrichum orbiculare MAFF 240422]|uniref:Uncharacterized protein n=1 Tax=Colletotrichum orbiculare (strain 104-T / ATCC 96160 / CBS 514.97 / LARS 414 / MAFF 240422) TaxID=1213857 RepID=A0A484FL22_COLOR|nr:hypothetical protein Cob_v008238 [Colletotrichum orbiculare MAFF 240422]